MIGIWLSGFCLMAAIAGSDTLVRAGHYGFAATLLVLQGLISIACFQLGMRQIKIESKIEVLLELIDEKKPITEKD